MSLALLAVGGVMILAVWLTHRRGSALALRTKQGRRKVRDAVRGDIDELTSEIEKVAQHLSEQLDDRCARLEKLIGQADRRINELETLIEDQNSPAPVPKQRLRRPVDSKISIAVGGPPEPAEPQDPLAKSVYALADHGLAPNEIADKLHEHIGKVELILALRNP
jgi:hypothetical protein